MTKVLNIDLNSAQEKVVNHGDGPLLVVAGAGTGKTRVIIEHINHLLQQGVPASAVLAVTFTEKAATEMQDRILEERSAYDLELDIMTFNAFGEKLLRRYSSDMGLSRNFTVLNDTAQIVFLRERLDSLHLDYFAPVSMPDALLGDIAHYFSQLKQQTIRPSDYTAYVEKLPMHDKAEKLEKKKHLELSKAYETYQELCRQANVIDYDDQIYLCLQLLEIRPNIRAELQARYHTIMVDEFQDTNPMQSRLIDLLVNEKQNVIVVGDDDQSIYGFRGATLANILQFSDRYPKASQISLTENYRSTQAILDTAYRLIKHNDPHRLEVRLGINKQLIAQEAGEPPMLKRFETQDQELQWIAEDIKSRVEAGANPGSIAVLARRNTTAQLVSEALSYNGVEYTLVGQHSDLYDDSLVRSVLEAIRTVVDPYNNSALYHTLSSVLFNIDPAMLSDLNATARRQNENLLDIIHASDGETQPAVEALKMIEAWRTSAALQSVGRLVYTMLDQTGLKDKLYAQAESDPTTAQTVTRLSQFFRTLKSFERIAIQPTAVQYLEALPALQAAGDEVNDDTMDLSRDRVNVLTVHKAKGLEWDTVYIVDCTERSFPMQALPSGLEIPDALQKISDEEADSQIAEERRLMYVATTRARKTICLTYSDSHNSGRPRKPSRFLSEMFDDITSHQHQPVQLAISLLPDTPPTAVVAVPTHIYDGQRVSLSVSQLTTYLRCPLDFYYSYILGIISEPNPAARYGTALHRIIENFHRHQMEGSKISAEELLTEMKDTWPKDGYLSAEQRNRAIAQAEQTARAFFKKHVSSSAPVEVELPFRVVLNDGRLLIRGRYDAVFETPSGVDIRDYKTSMQVDTTEKAKARIGSSDQVTLYALAWSLQHDELPAKMSFEFIDTEIDTEIKKTKRGLDTMQAKAIAAAEAIARGEFPPGNNHDFCRHQ